MHSPSIKYEKLNKNNKKNCCSKFHSYFLISPNARIYNTKLHCWSSIEDERRRHLDSFPWTIHPYSSFRWCWMSFMLVILIFSLIGHRPVSPSTPEDWFTYTVITATFMVDIIFHFRTGYPLDMQHSSKVAELNPKLIAKHYVKRWFIIDLVAAIPFELVSLLLSDKEDEEAVPIFISSLRLLKLIRLVRIFHYATILVKQEYIIKNNFRVTSHCWTSTSTSIQCPNINKSPCQSCYFPPPHHVALRRFEFDDDIITINEEDDEDTNNDVNVDLGSGSRRNTCENIWVHQEGRVCE